MTAALPFLDERASVPLHVPFTRRQALSWGVDDRRLRSWVARGLLLNPIRGVYYAAQLPDGIALRLDCVRLVVPEDAVVTDRTAGWLHGAPMILAPNDHVEVPAVSVFRQPGYRLRNAVVASGERTLLPRDVVDVGGVRVTSALRTACDLGRLLHRDQAFAALDALARTGAFELGELGMELPRFKGMRGVRQLRSLSPYVDPRAASPAESIMRLRWLDCTDLPAPEPQVAVPGPRGTYYLDLGVEELRYGLEYDGAAWHGPEQAGHDEARRTWIREREDWVVDVLRREGLFGPHADVAAVVRGGIAQARRRYGARAWQRLVDKRRLGAPRE